MNGSAKRDWIGWSLVGIGVITALIPIVGSYFCPMDGDSMVILAEMESIYEGYIPYKTLHLNYPPLWFYINCALKWLFNVPYGCYHFYLTVHWLFSILCAGCLYKLAMFWNSDKNVALLTAWMFLLVSHWLQGNVILFEIPSLFWGLLAFCLFYTYREKKSYWYILIGICASFAFLTKQYGLGFLPLLLWLVITDNNQLKFNHSLFLSIGYFIPICICTFLMGNDFLASIFGNGYGTTLMNAYYGINETCLDRLNRIIQHLFYFANRVAPLFYVAILCIPIAFRQDKWKELLFCIFGIIGFSLQFYFAGGNHYFLYLIPFVVLLIPILLSLEMKTWAKKSLYSIVVLMLILSLYSTYNNRVRKIYLHNGRELYNQQWIQGQKISSLIENDQKVFIIHGGLIGNYYTGHLYPPNMAEVGFACGPMEISIPIAEKQIIETDYVLCFSADLIQSLYPDGYVFEYFFTPRLQNVVEQSSMIYYNQNNIILYKKTK